MPPALPNALQHEARGSPGMNVLTQSFNAWLPAQGGLGAG